MTENHATYRAHTFCHTIDKKFNVFATKLQ